MAATLGVYRETASGEQRVALIPDAVPQARSLGLNVLIEFGAGQCAGFADERYAQSGATLTAGAELITTVDILLGVRPPNYPLITGLRCGQVLCCLLRPLANPNLMRYWADRGLTAIAVDLLPGQVAPASPLVASSESYAEMIMRLLPHLTRDGTVVIDLEDEILTASVVTHRREVVNDAVWQVILDETSVAGLP